FLQESLSNTVFTLLFFHCDLHHARFWRCHPQWGRRRDDRFSASHLWVSDFGVIDCYSCQQGCTAELSDPTCAGSLVHPFCEKRGCCGRMSQAACLCAAEKRMKVCFTPDM